MGVIERKEREKEHRKEEIIEAAQKVFFEKGLLNATMDEIAEAAELSKGTLYLYYKSKEDLYLTVMMRGMELLHEKYLQIVASNNSVVEKLLKFVDSYNDFFQVQRNFFKMFHFLQTPQFHKQVSEDMKQMCGAQSTRLWQLVINVLKHGMDIGLVRSDLDPVEVTIILWSSATALMLRNDSESEVWKELRNIDLVHTLEVSNKLLLNAILTDKGRNEFAEISNRKNI